LELEGAGLNQAGKDELKKLYAYHRAMYMEQRKYYHNVRDKAFNEPPDNPQVY
jgi:hypothetical protein